MLYVEDCLQDQIAIEKYRNLKNRIRQVEILAQRIADKGYLLDTTIHSHGFFCIQDDLLDWCLARCESLIERLENEKSMVMLDWNRGNVSRYFSKDQTIQSQRS